MEFDDWWANEAEANNYLAPPEYPLYTAREAWYAARQKCFEALCLGCREQLPIGPIRTMSGSPLEWAHECDGKTMICTASKLRVAVSLSDEKAKLKEE